MNQKNISRRSYLTVTGGVLASTLGIGSAKAFEEYKDWRNAPFSKDMTIIGHRGAAGIAPQNTEEAIRTAVKYGVDGVELDVQKTSDGRLVLFHDPIYDFSTDNGSGFVESTPYSEAKEFTIDGEPLLTLEEGLQIIKELDILLFLELKSNNIVDDCLEKVRNYGLEEQTTLISLESDYLKSAHDEIDTALIRKTPQEDAVKKAKEMGCVGVATHYFPINQESFIQQAEKAGLDSIIWNLFDTRTSIYDSLKSDADVLIANRPDIIAQMYSNYNLSQPNES